MTDDVCPFDATFCLKCGSTRRDTRRNVGLVTQLVCDSQWHDQPAPPPAAPVSATPRTDALVPHLNLSHMDLRSAAYNLHKLARQLERELAEAKKQINLNYHVVDCLNRGIEAAETSAAELQQRFDAAMVEKNIQINQLQTELVKNQELSESLTRLNSYTCNQRNELQAKLAAETKRAHNAAIDACHQISVDWDQLTYDEFRDKYSPNFHRSDAISALKVTQ